MRQPKLNVVLVPACLLVKFRQTAMEKVIEDVNSINNRWKESLQATGEVLYRKLEEILAGSEVSRAKV